MDYCKHCMASVEDHIRICPYCGHPIAYAAPAHHLQPNTILNARFLAGEAIGEGGFGITYIAKDCLLDLTVAIKEYYPRNCVSRDNTTHETVQVSSGESERLFFQKGKDRFLSEARVLAKLSHERGTVQVRDFFEQNNTAYIVMEYLSGETLDKYLEKTGVIDYEKAYRMLRPIMESMNRVHQEGLIHRDISPDNIMLTEDGTKLLDFGAAREAIQGSRTMTIMLKPGFAPIEQYNSKGKQGPWTDVYAMCATIYKCITGERPDDAITRQNAYVEGKQDLLPPSAFGATISPAFEKVLMTGLALYSKDRYQSFESLIAAFDAALRAPHPPEPIPFDHQQKAQEHISRSEDRDHASGGETKPVPDEKKKKTALKVALILLSVVLLAGALFGGFYVFKTQTTVVPVLAGLPAEDAKALLDAAALEGEFEYRESEPEQKDIVLEQQEKAESRVRKNSTIHYIVGNGKPFLLPDYTGKRFEEAKEELETYGIIAEIRSEEFAGGEQIDVPAGSVLRHSGKVGQPVEKGTVIRFVLSKGVEPEQNTETTESQTTTESPAVTVPSATPGTATTAQNASTTRLPGTTESPSTTKATTHQSTAMHSTTTAPATTTTAPTMTRSSTATTTAKTTTTTKPATTTTKPATTTTKPTTTQAPTTEPPTTTQPTTKEHKTVSVTCSPVLPFTNIRAVISVRPSFAADKVEITAVSASGNKYGPLENVVKNNDRLWTSEVDFFEKSTFTITATVYASDGEQVKGSTVYTYSY